MLKRLFKTSIKTMAYSGSLLGGLKISDSGGMLPEYSTHAAFLKGSCNSVRLPFTNCKPAKGLYVEDSK